ncbi:ABC transporter ATP-binding protein [Paenibacillus donghaensis]|uniref:ABC transporter ATP-binding protein n=1 Tax=Paenibacillus donghaensis TaxID=414771 RepID=A0A2Z2KU03_9BACL|nr:ABC transporter ATP-binding protein [Paenibacillus donghaensis]ASA25482.1 hypothetical protein B9T62_34985 [Paenibacillus donghaensis]
MKVFNFCKLYIFKHRLLLIVYVTLVIVTSLSSLVLPLFSGKLVDTLIIGGSLEELFYYCFILFSLSLISVVVGYLVNKLLIKIQTNASFELNVMVIEHVKSLPISFIENSDVAYLNQRINNDSNEIITFSISIIGSIIVNSSIFLVTFLVLIKSNVKIAIVFLFLIIIYTLLYKILKNPLYTKTMEYKESQSHFFSSYNEQLKNVRFIKTHSYNGYFYEKLKHAFDQFLPKVYSYQKISYIFSSFDNIMSTFAQISIFIVGGIEVVKGNLTIGFFTILINYFNMLISSTRFFFNLSKNYQEILVSYMRLQEILSIPIIEDGEKVMEQIDSIEFRDVTFAYKQNTIFEKSSFVFEKGKIYCLAGENGSGKSTLLSLILGLYINEHGGSILFNNEDIKNLNMSSIRLNKIGVTEQNPILLYDTVAKNILLDNMNHENMELLISQFYLNDFIERLPNGINSNMNENTTNLSGGEKQKISIVRQMLKNPDVMIFDEPTASLDALSRKTFIDHITEIKKNKIIIIVSHDSAIKDTCDEIINLDRNLYTDFSHS